MVIGGTSGGSTTNSIGSISQYASNGSTLQGHYLARNYAGTTISKLCGKTASNLNGIASSIGASGVQYPDLASGGMLLSKVYVHDADIAFQIRGTMPGLFNPLHNLPGNPGDSFSGVGPLSGKTLLLLDAPNGSTRCRVVLEISNTWE